MKNILASQNRQVLEQFARSNVLVAFDYDGTLAPIVAEPEHAAIAARTRRLLDAVTRLYPCIVISGRAQDDVLRKLRGIWVRGAIGNHGLEPWHGSNPALDTVQTWLPLLEASLGHVQGVAIENKLFSVALHYRRAREKKKTRAAILRAAASLGEVRIIGGKQVVNVLPSGAQHKGIALERERERLRCDTAIYVGDDETDEDVFALDLPGRLLTIRVGAKRDSMADYCIRDQSQIDLFLSALLEFGTSRAQQAGA